MPAVVEAKPIAASGPPVVVSSRGKRREIPSILVDGKTIVVTGRRLKVAELYDAEWIDTSVDAPDRIASALQTAPSRPDVFTFAQRLPDTEPRHTGHIEWDNLAVINITSYDAWLSSLSQDTRRNVRMAGKRGVDVRLAAFDDDLARGITGIYNETPVRQGRKFWHYGKDVATVKEENATYLDRSQFIGAYLGEELIGFLKMVKVGGSGSIMQILCKTCHQDKRPMNALIAKAVELCAQQNLPRLLYRQYTYHGAQGDALTEFKRRSGFEQVLVPRYYLPLTLKGRLALRLKLHRELRELLPPGVVAALLKWRAKYSDLTHKRPAPEAAGA